MLRSWRVGRLFGVPIDLHWTFLLVPVAMVGFAYAPGRGVNWARVGWWSALAVLLFSFVLAHELGHALVARRRGVRAERIVLFPLGGGAYLPERPPRVRDEVLVYAAGPLVNLLLATLALPLLLAYPQGEYLLRYYLNPRANLVVSPSTTELVLGTSVAVNAILAAGNLLPAYPLDGGRILQALLRRPLGARPATVVVTVLGVITGGALVYLSYQIGDPLLALGAGFVALLSVMEFRNGWQRRRLDALRVEDVLRPPPAGRRLFAADRVATAREAFVATGAPILPVFDHWNRLSGFLHHEVPNEEGAGDDDPVREYYEAEFVGAAAGENLLRVTERIVDADVYGAAVYGQRGRILGYVYTEDVIGLLDNWPRRLRRRLTPGRVRRAPQP